MIIHSTDSFSIYFGQASNGLTPAHYEQARASCSVQEAPFEYCKQILQCADIMFLHQNHGIDGSIIQEDSLIKPFSKYGDYLITKNRVALGVLTADCLPIVMIDEVQKIAAIVHAGWRGTVKKIACVALQKMQERYASHVDNVHVYFGPSAQVCCYEVGKDFLQELQGFEYKDQLIRCQQATYYFDMPLLNALQLQHIGIKSKNIHLDYAQCTICCLDFYSYRRQAQHAGRQMTVVCLK